MFGRIRTSATVAAVAAAMVVCGAPAAHADDGVTCNMPSFYATGSPGADFVVGEVRPFAVVTAHWACTSTDTAADYWMYGSITVYAYDGGSSQMVGGASDSMRSVAGQATVNPTMAAPARPASWHYARFSGSVGTRIVYGTSPMFYVP